MKDLMTLMKDHADSIAVIVTVVGALYFVKSDIDKQFTEIRIEMSEMNKDIAILKTVMIMHKIMPAEMAKAERK
jgi:hypothetical protein